MFNPKKQEETKKVAIAARISPALKNSLDKICDENGGITTADLITQMVAHCVKEYNANAVKEKK